MGKLEYRRLSPSEIESEVGSLHEWSVVEDILTKTFPFKTYQEGLVFASAVGYLADRLNHHPDIQIGYGKVSISVTTHDTKGLSPYDFEFARRIEAISV